MRPHRVGTAGTETPVDSSRCRGLLDLAAPVATYWPEFAQAGKAAIPVHFLLSHRAGLPAIDAPLPAEALYDWDTMTRALTAQKPWWEPGTQHGYHAFTFGRVHPDPSAASR